MKHVALAALLLVAMASPQHYRDDLRTANESARIYAAQAIARDHTLDLAPVFDRDFPGWQARGVPPNVDVAVRDGRFLLDKAPGITLAAIPVVAAIGGAPYHWQAWLLAVLLSALPTIGFVLAFRRWGAPWPIAAASVLATPWLVYAGLLFGHAACAALVGIGFVLALGPLEPADRSESATRRTPLWAGLCFGGAVLVEYTAAVLVAVALLAIALDPARRRQLPWLVLGGVAPAIALALWNTAAFGAPWRMSYAFKANPAMAQTHAHGVYGIGGTSREALFGITLSARRGLFFFAPWLVTGVVGAVWAAMSKTIARAWRIALPLGIAAFVLVIAGFPDWHGGRAYGPRYLVPAIPLFAIGVVALLRLTTHRYLAALLSGLVAAGVVLAVAGAYVDVYSSSQITNPAFEINLPILLWTGPAPTIWSTFLPRIIGLLIGVIALIGAFAVDIPRRIAALPIAIAVATAIVVLVIAMRPATDDQALLQRQRALAHQLLDQPP